MAIAAYIPEIRLRRAGEDPCLAGSLSETRSSGLCVDNVLNSLSNKTRSTCNENHVGHVFYNFELNLKVEEATRIAPGVAVRYVETLIGLCVLTWGNTAIA